MNMTASNFKMWSNQYGKYENCSMRQLNFELAFYAQEMNCSSEGKVWTKWSEKKREQAWQQFDIAPKVIVNNCNRRQSAHNIGFLSIFFFTTITIAIICLIRGKLQFVGHKIKGLTRIKREKTRRNRFIWLNSHFNRSSFLIFKIIIYIRCICLVKFLCALHFVYMYMYSYVEGLGKRS